MSGFPISMATPARFTAPLPKAADVVVVGGGIMGVMTAWYLAEAGIKVVLCEKGRVGGTVQPQLGLDSPAGSRSGRIADHG